MSNRFIHALLGFTALSLAACGNGSTSGIAGSSSGAFRIIEASNGFGKLLPYSIQVADANGIGTGTTIEINDYGDLLANLTPLNGVLPPVKWKNSTELPNAAPGNHFIYVRFNQAIKVDSVLSSAASSGVDNNLVGNIQVVSVNAATGETIPVPGRGFVGGKTYGSPDPANPGQLLLEDWVLLNNGKPEAQVINGATPGLGYPGTEADFSGANVLVSPNVFVFVVDSDGDLTTHETFPTGFQIQMKITKGTTNVKGRALEEEGVASSTVGDDTIPPEVLVAGSSQSPVIIPSDGEIGVDPQTNIEITFTEPIQFLSIGSLDDGSTPVLSSAIQLQFGPSTSKVDVPFSVSPFSVFDLTRIQLRPLYNFPGSGPDLGTNSCADFSTVDITINPDRIEDLSGLKNTVGQNSSFTTAEGPGLVNAPVLPDAVYLGRGGSSGGISVIDLNGFGQGPGNPSYDPLDPTKRGNTNLLNNPNYAVQGSILIPPVAQGTCTVDGGSSGPFSLAKDSSLNDILVTSPVIETVTDMAVGNTLDLSFNNGSPFGCQSGGGNICAQTGLKNISIATAGSSTLLPSQAVPPGVSVFTLKTELGAGNLVSWAPHPNPPPLIFPPLCLSPLIGAQEPTSINTTLPPPLGPGLTNLLAPSSNPLGVPSVGIPPGGLLSPEQNAFFVGPSPPQQNIAACVPYGVRQQIGNFLYVADRSRGEVVVLNSNRFTVLDRITLPDPTSLAMSPNLNMLAVTNERADQVSFIDIDAKSATFHQVVKTVVVGRGPTGIAWTQDNEDILVCNTGDGSMTVLSAFNFEPRKLIRNQLRSPFEVVTVPRMQAWAFSRQVYYAFILNADGTVSVFESGPDGVNGWGFDDVIGTVPFTFQNPKAIAVDPAKLQPQFFVAHENKLDLFTGVPTGDVGGAVTGCGMSSGTIGRIPLDTSLNSNPRLRDIQFKIFVSVGSDQLTGVPVDIAFDNMMNRTALTNITSTFSAGKPLSINGKSIIKLQGGGAAVTVTPTYMFLAVPNSFEGPGVVDVLSVNGGYVRVDTNAYDPGIQSIPAPNVNLVVDYLRQ
ncbi:MAG TPA: hypothetical protein ENJ09_11175 [Planctomycetes bacterium]|nr:hypothetical protein [Planctomycetota bacterium]